MLVLATNPNVLFLDEPTNDLDLDTLRALEAFLEDWPGALVAVSHDRAFLERVMTDVIVVDESTRAGRVPGGFAAWLETRRANRRRGHAATRTESGGSDKAATKSSSTDSTSAEAGPSKSPLRHQLKQTDQAMAKQQKQVDALRERLEGITDHGELAELGTELASAQGELDQLEEQWMELSLQLES